MIHPLDVLEYYMCTFFLLIVVEYDPTKEIIRSQGYAWSGRPGPPPRILWAEDHLNTSHVNITFVMFRYAFVYSFNYGMTFYNIDF